MLWHWQTSPQQLLSVRTERDRWFCSSASANLTSNNPHGCCCRQGKSTQCWSDSISVQVRNHHREQRGAAKCWEVEPSNCQACALPLQVLSPQDVRPHRHATSPDERDRLQAVPMWTLLRCGRWKGQWLLRTQSIGNGQTLPTAARWNDHRRGWSEWSGPRCRSGPAAWRVCRGRGTGRAELGKHDPGVRRLHQAVVLAESSSLETITTFWQRWDRFNTLSTRANPGTGGRIFEAETNRGHCFSGCRTFKATTAAAKEGKDKVNEIEALSALYIFQSKYEGSGSACGRTSSSPSPSLRILRPHVPLSQLAAQTLSEIPPGLTVQLHHHGRDVREQWRPEFPGRGWWREFPGRQRGSPARVGLVVTRAGGDSGWRERPSDG